VNSPSVLGTATLLLALSAQAANLSVLGDWFEPLGPASLVGGAGTDIRPLIESRSYQTGVGIAGAAGEPWTLVVQRSAANLPAGVTLAVRRTGSGTCPGLVGGTNYQEIGDQAQALFSGRGDCNGIGIQLRLEGISVRQAPGAFGTTLLYSLQ
jgi:hypothetical protein